MSPIKILGLTLFLSCFASFAWAINSLFKRAGAPSPWMNAVSALGMMFAFLHAYVIITATILLSLLSVIGIFLYILSLVLFWSAVPIARRSSFHIAFTHVEPRAIVRNGPYRWIRHPFYTAYFLFWTAGVLFSQWAWLALSVIVMGALYIRAADQEEREFAASGVSDEYNLYKARTRRFIPYIW